MNIPSIAPILLRGVALNVQYATKSALATTTSFLYKVANLGKNSIDFESKGVPIELQIVSIAPLELSGFCLTIKQ